MTRQALVLLAIGKGLGVSVNEIMCHRRDSHLCEARHIAMWVMRQCFPALSIPMLGRCFDRDHTTILHGLKRAEQRMERKPDLREIADMLVAQIGVVEPGIVVDDATRERIRLAAEALHSDLAEEARSWCDQCQRMASRGDGEACNKRFCSLRHRRAA